MRIETYAPGTRLRLVHDTDGIAPGRSSGAWLLFLEADSQKGTLELRYRNRWSWTRQETIEVGSCSRLELVLDDFFHPLAEQPDPAEEPAPPCFELAVYRGKRPLKLRLSVGSVDTRDEVLDLGRRLAEVLGFESGEIVLNEPRRAVYAFYQVAPDRELAHALELGEAAASASATGADEWATALASHYAEDAADERALKKLIARPWSPAGDPFGCRITRHEPGRRLVDGRVYKSADGGEDWTLLRGGEDYGAGLLVDPRLPQDVYVAILQAGVYGSRDGGGS